MSQIPPIDQQHYPSHPLRRNSKNEDRGSGDPLGNGSYYPHRSNGHGGPHATPVSSDDDPYRGGSDSFPSSEFGRLCSHDQCSEQHKQFEENMTAINN